MVKSRAGFLLLAFALACGGPPAGAQSFQDQQRQHYEREQRERDDQARRRQQESVDWDRNFEDLKRDRERYGTSPAQGGGGDGGGSVLGPLIVLAIAGALLEYSRRPERQRPVIDYVQETQQQRRHFVYRKCKTAREASLVRPVYQPPNKHALVRLFQSDRGKEFQDATNAYNAALQESEPTCRCVGDSAVAPAGFSEAEWRQIGERSRGDRPWDGLEAARVKGLFEACAAKSPSDTQLSWLYAAPAR